MGQSLNTTIRFFGTLAVNASKPDAATGDINIIDPGGPKDRVHQCGTKGLVFKKQEDQEKYHNPRGVNLPDQLKHLRRRAATPVLPARYPRDPTHISPRLS